MLEKKAALSLEHAVNICKQHSVGTALHSDIVFFSLPYWDIYTPFSAVPCLVGVLQEKGWKAQQIDIGILYFHELFIKRRRLAWALIKSKFFYHEKVEPFESSGVHSYEEYLESIDWLSKDKMDLAALRAAYPTLNDFQRGVLSAFYGALWINKRKRSNRLHLRLPQLLEGYDFTPFFNVISRFNLFPILNNLPPVAGISITSLDQLAASCLWAIFLKKLHPDITLIAGGSCTIILRNCNRQAWEQFFDFFDYVCTGEGETCTAMLVNHIYNGVYELGEIPNLAYRAGDTVTCTMEAVENVEALPPPCYVGIDQSLYLTPEPMLSYQTSRGCFWGKCAFCDFDKKWRSNFRQKSIEKVNADLKFLHTTYAVNNFTFVDEAIEPKFFSRWIPELEKEAFSQYIHWLAYMKVSPHYSDELIARAKRCGLTMVMLGVETFNQRLLRFIRKGILAKNSIQNLNCFHANGVKTHAWLMGLLPSQTKEELIADFTTIKKCIDDIDNVYMGSFILFPSTDIFSQPHKFNIIQISEAKDIHYDGYTFSSTYNGQEIDIEKLKKYLNGTIRPFISKKKFITNRYDRFFDDKFFAEKNTVLKQQGKK
ncbi:B12-binding domain-containing radical SAM protein [Desulfovibrio fairfieldensis]|uniref:B12-binding domain-containing radical SAM protein n=1 Tax=Desulfovibrio fairfieldensis TaxID=44742 RepID=UPI0009F89DF4|nr:radical SAM protein [Desulfovibrio fairfieldensis]